MRLLYLPVASRAHTKSRSQFSKEQPNLSPSISVPQKIDEQNRLISDHENQENVQPNFIYEQ